MTSLIFHTEESQVLVATDTLATSLDGEPFMFTTKAFIVPHLKMIMCGTGMGGFLGKWFVQVNDRMIVRGMDNLDHHTPRNLASMWHEYKEGHSIPDDLTSTVYHFGFSEEDGFIHAYAYRSTCDFQSERISPPYGMGVKPECQIPENYELPRVIKQMMDEQRIIQSSKLKEHRVHVGGEIQIYHLTQMGFNVYTLDRFEDYDLNETAIYENYHSKSPDV